MEEASCFFVRLIVMQEIPSLLPKPLVLRESGFETEKEEKLV